MSMEKAYIASGWFNPEWLQELEDIKALLDKHGLKYFSPRDEAICPPDAGLDVQQEIFDGNVNALQSCSWMLCNTREKDPGSVWESGNFYGQGKPIVYFAGGLPEGALFNLMLAKSGIKVCMNLAELDDYLSRCVEAGHLLEEPYAGHIE